MLQLPSITNRFLDAELACYAFGWQQVRIMGGSDWIGQKPGRYDTNYVIPYYSRELPRCDCQATTEEGRGLTIFCPRHWETVQR